ncbi:MAG: GGDEF domain-containing protein [Cyanobacteria bacterium M5B4]|nr:MAG: GGDEF domain-containing protein [Cyanobacteria bacterium M5B4]
MESSQVSLLLSENNLLRAHIDRLYAIQFFLLQENKRLRDMEQHLLTALEIALLDKSDLEIMLDLAVSHGDVVEKVLYTAAEQAWHVAGIDELTQLPNRRQFLEYLDRMWRQMTRQGQSLTILMCDVDFFKHFNDFYGHQAGDMCLYRVAQGIASALHRPIDLAARYGGEEFVVVLPNTDRSGALKVAEAIRTQIAQLQILHETSAISNRVTISIGLASAVPHKDISPAALLQSADEALFRAKALGRDRVVAAP